MKRTITTLTLLSAVLFCFLTALWPVSYFLNLSRSLGSHKLAPSDSILITPHYHLGVEGGSMWLYTYEMPYRGSIFWLGFPDDAHPVVHAWTLGDYGFSHVVYFHRTEEWSKRACDLPGVYFRRFRWFDGRLPYTTLRVSLSYPILLSAALPLWWIFRRRHKTTPNTGLQVAAPLV